MLNPLGNEIVKVQRPISPPNGPWLAYTKGHKNAQHFHPDASTARAMGEDLKGYFRANWQDGRWHIGKRVGEQSW